MSSSPVILHLIDSFGIGGAQQRYFNDLRLLGPPFQHMPCVVFDDAGASLSPGQPISARSLELRRLREIPVGVARLVRLLRENPAIRLIHTQLFAADVIGRIAGRLCGRAVVSTVQSAIYEPESGLYSAWRHRTDRATTGWLARVIAVSDFVRRSVHARLNVPLEKIAVIPNTVDTGCVGPDPARRLTARATLGIPSDTFAWLTVGRLHAAKGVAYLLTAFERLVAAEPATLLLIVGGGPQLEELQQRAAAAGVLDRVRFLGERSDVPALLDAADAFVFPSLSEGLPVAVLEAMAMEKPCVLSRIGPHEEMVEHQVSGVLVSPRDAAGLAVGMSEVQASAAYRRSLGVRARVEVVRRFDARSGARELQNLYREVLS